MIEEALKEWLDNDQIAIDIWKRKYQYNNETFEAWLDRVSNYDPDIKRLIREKKFIFGGRILKNRGTKIGTYSNCYSRGFIGDNLKDILQANTDIALTYKAQGGQGLSLSKLRPKGAPIGDTGFVSDGIIPFMKMYAQTTATISQGGSRKGALLISLDINHPEAKSFITIKSDEKALNTTNLSLEIDDKFMECIEDFLYEGITTTYTITKEYDSGSYEYEIIPIELFRLLCKNAWQHAEPGVIFTEQFRNYNLMQHIDAYQIETCNPFVYKAA